ncbi:MAG: STAS domain-containing protein [Planctomycetota bacterium]|nr:STAS domain-containing protein [Planctomycetota bacterium]
MSSPEKDLLFVEARDGCHVVRLASQALFDPIVINRVQSQLHALIADATPPRIVLSLDTIDFIPSSTISLLLSVRSASQGKGGDAVLAAVPPSVMGILKIARLDGVFRIFDSADAAVATLSA